VSTAISSAEVNSSGRNQTRPSALKYIFILATFLGAFLMFQLEPLAGKILTPRFGGTASIWSVCLLFFQVMVLGGYGLTVGLSHLRPRMQQLAYGVLLCASLAWAAIPPASYWINPAGNTDPAWQVLVLLVKNLGIPCLILASVSGMMQVWYRGNGLGNPYPLYSISNVGSLGSLLAYPILFEPNLTITHTLSIWKWTYGALIVLMVAGSIFSRLKTQQAELPSASETPDTDGIRQWPSWIFLSMCGSLVLMTSTAYITSDIAPVPLLWVLPLAVYLLTFVLVFAGDRYYRPGVFTYSWMAIACAEQWLGENGSLARVGLNLALVFLMCMVCHGELAASKPHPKHLPLFYFCLSLGGAIGGILVAFAAPMLLPCDVDRWIVVAMVAILSALVMVKRKLFGPFKATGYTLVIMMWCILVFDGCYYLNPMGLVHRERNFYGAVEVRKSKETISLFHGKILHGRQFLDPEDADVPTTYYGHAISLLDDYAREPDDHPVTYGVVGLGTGTMAAYGQEGDEIDYFELDPKIKRIALKYFTFISHSKAKVNITLGDGRAQLQQWSGKHFDLLLVDAFNGDAVPLHLLTVEALEIYMNNMKPDGLVVFHLTNRYANLVPPVAKAGEKLGLSSLLVTVPNHRWKYLVLTRRAETIESLRKYCHAHAADYPDVSWEDPPVKKGSKCWTDDFANVFSALQ
jgi:hypothetical protein